MSTRPASHADSWYSGDQKILQDQLNDWLSESNIKNIPKARVIIAPHAGYAYSGSTAAWAYKCWDVSKAKRCFILGPSHHFYLQGCAISQYSTYKTPLGDLKIDAAANLELLATDKFALMSHSTDNDEHSIEMQLPYIYSVLSSTFEEIPPIVPILVGSLSAAQEFAYGKIIAPHLADPDNLFVISSDFCHWGSRFHFTACNTDNSTVRLPEKLPSPIWQYIEELDHSGMKCIENGCLVEFQQYIRSTKNTICGRHPIAVIMAAMEDICTTGRFNFVKYAQSNKVSSFSESSVSYASAYAQIT